MRTHGRTSRDYPTSSSPKMPLSRVELLGGWRHSCSAPSHSRSDFRGRPWAHYQCHSGKAEASARVVDHVYLAHIRPRLQLRQRHIELERHRPPLGGIDRRGFHQGRLIDLHSATQELNTGQHPHRPPLPPGQPRRARRLGRALLLRGVIHLVQKIKMLVPCRNTCGTFGTHSTPSRTRGFTVFFAVFGTR